MRITVGDGYGLMAMGTVAAAFVGSHAPKRAISKVKKLLDGNGKGDVVTMLENSLEKLGRVEEKVDHHTLQLDTLTTRVTTVEAEAKLAVDTAAAAAAEAVHKAAEAAAVAVHKAADAAEAAKGE